MATDFTPTWTAHPVNAVADAVEALARVVAALSEPEKVAASTALLQIQAACAHANSVTARLAHERNALGSAIARAAVQAGIAPCGPITGDVLGSLCARLADVAWSSMQSARHLRLALKARHHVAEVCAPLAQPAERHGLNAVHGAAANDHCTQPPADARHRRPNCDPAPLHRQADGGGRHAQRPVSSAEGDIAGATAATPRRLGQWTEFMPVDGVLWQRLLALAAAVQASAGVKPPAAGAVDPGIPAWASLVLELAASPAQPLAPGRLDGLSHVPTVTLLWVRTVLERLATEVMAQGETASGARVREADSSAEVDDWIGDVDAVLQVLADYGAH